MGRCELLNGAAYDFAASIAEDLFRGGVPGQNAAIVAKGDDGFPHALDESLQIPPCLEIVLVRPLELRVELVHFFVLLFQGILDLLQLGIEPRGLHIGFEGVFQ